MPINVLIGKNNCGKSSVLDVISGLFTNQKDNTIEQIYLDILLSDTMIKEGFSESTSGGSVPGQNHYSYGKNFKDRLLRISAYGYNYLKDVKDDESVLNDNANDKMYGNWSTVGKTIRTNMKNIVFFRLDADRDIVPEKEESNIGIDSSGRGTSNLIRKVINNSQYNEKLIEETLLNDLNQIMMPESIFTRIRVQQIGTEEDPYWEVFLEEKNGRFPLSQSGSGLKTIILVLINLRILPRLDEYKDKHFVYAFEEIENNLHPALQRRIFEFIYHYSVTNDITIFLTTHSHVAINSFFSKNKAQIYRVYKNNEYGSSIKQIDNYVDKVEILDDLDVKASDLLQSNGLIWVEGPSDRIYIKRWLDVLCNCKYDEGKHYQFMYYGGRLLSHYSTEEADGLINILLTNRNAAIVIDSDKRNQQTQLNNTKKRIIEEFSKYKMLSWVTKGKEIENYVSAEALSLALNKDGIKQCAQYQLFPDYIKEYYSNFGKGKVDFANSIKDSINQSNSKDILDLERQVKNLYSYIEKWNSI